MKAKQNNRGFRGVYHPDYITQEESCIVKESSAIGEDSREVSFLWFGNCIYHLDKAEVEDFISHLQHWVDHGRLPMADGETSPKPEKANR